MLTICEPYMTTAILSIGGNLGNRIDVLRSAVRSITALPNVKLVKVSSVYETPPWGPIKQPDFLNAIVVIDVSSFLKPLDLLRSLQQIESEHGRTRDIRWGPRTLDIDIIAFGKVKSNNPKLLLPHPRAHEREFVLVPWLEVEPHAKITGLGTVSSLLETLDPSTVTKLPNMRLT
jgi:2-amino-4-hydroxy-6-hydroxymethyldihydropteridine diphosphokinase